MSSQRDIRLAALSERTQNVVIVGACDGISHDPIYRHVMASPDWVVTYIEPVDKYYKLLVDRMGKRANTNLVNAAVMNYDGVGTIAMVDPVKIEDGSAPAWANGVSTFYPNKGAISRLPDLITENVKCSTFRAISEDIKLGPIDILQIDTEGSDYQVFRQVWDAGHRPNIIAVEVMMMDQGDLVEMLTLLDAAGYACTRDSVNKDDLIALLPIPCSETAALMPPPRDPSPEHIRTGPLKVGFFIHTEWAFGAIHKALVKELYTLGIDSNLIDWQHRYSAEEIAAFASTYDLIVTTPGTPATALATYGVEPEQILVIAHGQWDIQEALSAGHDFDAYGGYGCVSNSLARFSAEAGISRAPVVVQNGVNFAEFYRPPSQRLRTIGYCGKVTRGNHHSGTTDWKRGYLVKSIAAAVGLPLVIPSHRSHLAMADYYRHIDCLMVSSNEQESCGLPLLESAAAGRLPVAPNIGINADMPAPTGVILPMDEDGYTSRGVQAISSLTQDDRRFAEGCREAQDYAREYYDWPRVIGGWAGLITDSIKRTGSGQSNRKSTWGTEESELVLKPLHFHLTP